MKEELANDGGMTTGRGKGKRREMKSRLQDGWMSGRWKDDGGMTRRRGKMQERPLGVNRRKG